MQNMLCVVDMQYPFVNAEDSACLKEVVQAVRSTRQRGEHIFVLEDRGGSSTVAEIMAELDSYSRVSVLSKGQWDGSLQIAIELSDRLKLVPARITTCGAFAEECVTATLLGLRERFPLLELEVLRLACVPRPVSKFGPSDWLSMSRRLRVTLS